MGDVLAIANHKGGVGKTAITVILASTISWLQRNKPDELPEEWRKKPILIIDTDPQANTTEALGFEPADLIMDILDLYNDPSIISNGGTSIILSTRKLKNIELIPSSIRLEKISVQLAAEIAGNVKLRQVVNKLKDRYSVIIIDTPPSLGIFTQNAVVAADSVIIPLTLSKHALLGVSNMLSFMRDAREINKDLNVLGMVVNAFDRRYRLQQALLMAVRKEYNGFVFDTVIPTSARIVENIAMRRNALHNITPDHRNVLISFVKEVADRMRREIEIPSGKG